MATTSYYQWFELKTVHPYFSDSHPPLSLVPTPETSVILKSNDIIFQYTNGTFHFYYGTADATEIDITQELEYIGMLEFQVVTDDPYFFNYTYLPFPDPGVTLLFRNITNSPELQIEIASSEEHLSKNGIEIGILQINIKDLSTEHLTLTFNTRLVFHKYLIISPPGRNLEITSINIYGLNNEAYEGPVEELISNGQKGLAFTSTVPLPLSEKPTGYPKLKAVYQDGHTNRQEIEIDLPHPSPELLRIFEGGINDGEFFSSSIIYI